jgi:hypothetical protein
MATFSAMTVATDSAIRAAGHVAFGRAITATIAVDLGR